VHVRRGVLSPSLEKLLTVRQVAELLQVSTATVYKLVAEGKLAHVRVRNSIRFKASDVKL
jgi:excisionase family DNA binding protein